MSDVKAMQAKWKRVLCHILDSLGGLIAHTQLFTSNLPAANQFINQIMHSALLDLRCTAKINAI